MNDSGGEHYCLLTHNNLCMFRDSERNREREREKKQLNMSKFSLSINRQVIKSCANKAINLLSIHRKYTPSFIILIG